MARIKTAFACCAVLAALAGCSGDSSKSAAPASPAAAPDAKKVDTATASTIKGKVVLEGTPPENPVIKMTSDPACGNAEVRAESYLVNDGALQNVFVYIKDGLGNKYIFDTPTEPVKLDQKNCHYVPHVLGVRVTQPLEVSNSDETLHNVHGVPQVNREFNQGQPIVGMKNTVSFTSPEVMIPFKCDVHAWMSAYVGVVSHPYFAVTAREGTFELKTVPPGTYTIEAWHEKLGRQTQTVTLGEKDSKDVTFTFKVTQ
ncbi:MAG TPA: carboxypeptidase regulatory-like domain-containing protein [Vicinamibacterales bacterium]|nr:carboxypeptidase regulatory-like domain-containing protein [Vicinamibacterales bacterium]